MTNEVLLDHLGLLVEGKLKRAAVMLFYSNPERLITGSYVKIGRFGEGADLQYQDELHGSLLVIADRIIELIFTKYLKAPITYEKEIRIETYPFPRDAVREAVYNALIHKLCKALHNLCYAKPIVMRSQFLLN
jgi:ATP-dependent DNA helicase RecG